MNRKGGRNDYCFHASITTYTSNSCTKFRKINLFFVFTIIDRQIENESFSQLEMYVDIFWLCNYSDGWRNKLKKRRENDEIVLSLKTNDSCVNEKYNYQLLFHPHDRTFFFQLKFMFIELHGFYSRVNREIKVTHLLLTGTYRRTAMNEVNHQSLSIEEKKTR
jgi:hypothetical protein